MKFRKIEMSEDSNDPLKSDDDENFGDYIDFEETPEIPYEDRTCDICGRKVLELRPYDGPEHPTIGFISGAKLFKNFRWDNPFHVGSTRECLDCFARPEPIYCILEKERQLGRQLKFSELNEIRQEWNVVAERYKLEMALRAYDEKVDQERARSGGQLTNTELKAIQRDFDLLETCPDGGLPVLEIAKP